MIENFPQINVQIPNYRSRKLREHLAGLMPKKLLMGISYSNFRKSQLKKKNLERIQRNKYFTYRD